MIPSTVPDAVVEAMQFMDERHYIHLIGAHDTDVYKPDGNLLLVFRRRRLLWADCTRAFKVLWRAARHTNRRTTAAGGAAKFLSGTVGFKDGKPTAFTRKDRKGWLALVPLLQAIDTQMKEHLPPWALAAQLEAAERTPSGLLIPGTSATTAQVNRDARMAVHPDAGNLEDAFGAITVIQGAEQTGGLLVFPKYRVACDLKSRDVLIADTHELHGNTNIEGTRLSVVLYFHCSNLP